MSGNKDAITLMVAADDLTNVDDLEENSLGTPAMTTGRLLYVVVSGGGGGGLVAVASVISAYATDGDDLPLNALLTAALATGYDVDGQTTHILGAGCLQAGLSIASGATARGIVSISALYGQDQLGGPDDGSFQPVGVVYLDEDEIGGNNAIRAGAFGYVYNQDLDAWDRVRTGDPASLADFDSYGSVKVSKPGEWTETDEPAEDVAASAVRAADVAGTRHVVTAISATIAWLAAATEAIVSLRLLNGAAVIQTWRFAVGGGSPGTAGIGLTGLNIVADAAESVTLEFDDGGGADTFENVSMTGFTAV